jgi:hypothetical protein
MKKYFLPAGILVVFASVHLGMASKAQPPESETGVSPVKPVPTAPAEARARQLIYTLAGGRDSWEIEERRRIVEAMDAAVLLYNQMGEFQKDVRVSYNPATPTADGNYNGSIRFGGQIGKRTALHELGHVLGVGTHPKWRSFIVDGKWTGAYALAQLRAFDGPDAVLHADRQHFWPYGLNFDRESSPENDRRHVLMVAAFQRDLQIVNGNPQASH